MSERLWESAPDWSICWVWVWRRGCESPPAGRLSSPWRSAFRPAGGRAGRRPGRSRRPPAPTAASQRSASTGRRRRRGGHRGEASADTEVRPALVTSRSRERRSFGQRSTYSHISQAATGLETAPGSHDSACHTRVLLTSYALSVGANSVKAPSWFNSSARPDSRIADTNLRGKILKYHDRQLLMTSCP